MITLPMVISDLKPYLCSPFTFPKTFRELRGIYLCDGEKADDPSMIYVGTADSITRLCFNFSWKCGIASECPETQRDPDRYITPAHIPV